MTITCPGCGEECSVVTADNGIGAGEYWGATFYDSRPFPASNCCEVEIPEADLPDNEPDYEAMRNDRDDYYGEPPF